MTDMVQAPDDGIESLIGRLFTGGEPPHRDFAERAIANGEKALRRDRRLVVSGVTLGVVAVIVAAASFAGGLRGKLPAVLPTPAGSAPPSPTVIGGGGASSPAPAP